MAWEVALENEAAQADDTTLGILALDWKKARGGVSWIQCQYASARQESRTGPACPDWDVRGTAQAAIRIRFRIRMAAILRYPGRLRHSNFRTGGGMHAPLGGAHWSDPDYEQKAVCV